MGRSNGLKWSPQMLKREFFEYRRQQRMIESFERKEKYLAGDIFEGAFTPDQLFGKPLDYKFKIFNNCFEVGRADIDRFEEDTVRVLCDLVPEGQRHPMSVCRGMWSPLRYNDPAYRLGIKITGLRIAAGIEGHIWVLKRGDSDQ